MKQLISLTLFFFSLAASAQTLSLEGVVKSASGAALANVNVAATLLPIDDAEDVTATTVTDDAGRFHFDNLKTGKYSVAAASETVCGGAVIVDLVAARNEPLTITSGTDCRKVSGRVIGATGVHVIAGHFHDQQTDLYSVPVHGDRYAIALPVKGMTVVQALAPDFASVETPVSETNAEARDLHLERKYREAPAAAMKWIKEAAIPLKTVVAGNGFEDMAPLRKVVGSARVVELGEATHGTREFFQFKHRMLEFLVSQMGFDLFAIEASEPDAIAVNDYVLDGKGDPAAALKGLGFWTWDTEEVLDMIRWMRKWNEDPSHARKIQFVGFDMQNPAASRARLKTWLAATLPDALPLLDKTAALDPTPGKQPSHDQQEEVSRAIAELAARVDALPQHDETWKQMRHFVDLLQQAIPMMTRTDPSARDRAMAENVRWLLDQSPKSKMVVWAHNGHVAAEPYPFSPGGTMGVHLRKAYGDQVVVIGFAFNRGSFRAVSMNKGLIEHKVEPLDAASFENALATAGPPIFVLDLRKAKGEARTWVDSALPMRSVGAVYNDPTPKSYVGRIHPLRSFDAVFFVNETTAARQVKVPMPKPAPAAVNLSFDDGIKGWALSSASTAAGFAVRAAVEGCVHGGCAILSRPGDKTGPGFGSLVQRIDATPYRGKKIRLRAKMKSALIGDASSARIWLRVDRPEGMGFFDNMGDRAPKSLPEWTDLEIVGDVAADAEAIAFGELFLGNGEAWIDDVELEVTP